MKKIVLGCFFLLSSFGACAIEEIIITGDPYSVPAPTFDYSNIGSSSVSSQYRGPASGGGYKDQAIAEARKECGKWVSKQKKACDDKRDSYLDLEIQRCDRIATNGTTQGGVGVGVAATGGVAAGLLGGPVGWTVLLVFGGGGSVAAVDGYNDQQLGNYGCRDQANRYFKENTQACINYANKLANDICSKIY